MFSSSSNLRNTLLDCRMVCTIVEELLNAHCFHLPIRWNAFLSGRTHITIPNSAQSVWITGGKHGLLLAADTADVSTSGHVSSTGNEEVTGLMIPTAKGELPSHNVLHQSPCTREEMEL